MRGNSRGRAFPRRTSTTAQTVLSPPPTFLGCTHWLSAAKGLREFFYTHFLFCVFAFVNRNRGHLLSSPVQGPAALTQDEPLAEMHLHALCRYSPSVTAGCHLQLFHGYCFSLMFSPAALSQHSGRALKGTRLFNSLTVWLLRTDTELALCFIFYACLSPDQ